MDVNIVNNAADNLSYSIKYSAENGCRTAATDSKIIAVWGSPHSGKTVFSTKLAGSLYEKSRATVIVLYTDSLTPSLPVIFPNHKTADLFSVGTVLSGTDIFANDIVSNLITLKERMNLGFMGYRNGESSFSFPEYNAEKIQRFMEVLRDIADYIVVDCVSNPSASVFSETAMRNADVMLRLCTPDLSCMAFYQSQLSVMMSRGLIPDKQYQVMNVPTPELTMLASDAGTHLGKFIQTIPYSTELKEQYLEGSLCMPTKDRKYVQAVRAVVEAIRR